MKKLPSSISSKFGRQQLLLQKNSPTILFGAGVLGVVGTTVLACRATLKLEEVLETAQSDLHTASIMAEERPEDYTEADHKKDVSIVYVRSVVSVAKLYAPAIMLGTASVAALTSSHNILNRRNAALTAAYATIEKGFDQYRERVVEKYGEDQDRDFRYGTQEIEIKDEKTGKTKKVKRVADDAPSIYAKFFDQFSSSWSKEPEYNLAFLRCQQQWANDLLRLRGHLFLNEVYDALGMERTSAGSVVGWIIDKGISDNYVDFGIWDVDNEGCVDFVNGREGAILLDFNVDGVIYDKIDTHKEAIAWQK